VPLFALNQHGPIISLIRARLLEAQTRISTAHLEGEAIELRNHLAYLTGFSEEELELIPGSIRPLPKDGELKEAEEATRSYCELELQAKVRELIAARDTAQLIYRIAERDAVRTAGLISTTLGEQLASQIRGDEKFSVLLDATFELQQAQFELLAAEQKIVALRSHHKATRPGSLRDR